MSIWSIWSIVLLLFEVWSIVSAWKYRESLTMGIFSDNIVIRYTILI
jgi:hypothetical protein